ncbi:nucleotidyltransferase family protein [Enterococcus casseliflavus]
MIYTIKEIKEICFPIFFERNLKRVYLFGSYARNMATNTSDLDFLMDGEGSSLKSLFDQIDLQLALEAALEKEVDLITVNAINSVINQKKSPGFKENIEKDLVVIYDRDERTTSINQNLNSN